MIKSLPFFNFKNKETDQAIRKVISEYEGIPNIDKINSYLLQRHSIKKAKLIVEAKTILNNYLNKHRELNASFTDFQGIINLVMADMLNERIIIGEKYLEEYKKENGKHR